MRQLRREVGAMQARTARRGRVGDEDDDHDGHDDEDDDEDGRERHVATADGEYYELEEAPLTLSERGAIIGSVLLSPAGMPGLLVGGAFGAGEMTDSGYVRQPAATPRPLPCRFAVPPCPVPPCPVPPLPLQT